MHKFFLSLVALALCAVSVSAQITPITAAGLVSPQTLDFDTGAPAPGPIFSNDPYFTAFGLCDITIINAPGTHFPSGDVLSSGGTGNSLASVNNTLAIVAQGGALDNHNPGAGWSFRLDPGLLATQFGCEITDQTNHSMAVETWLGGVLQNTYTFTMAGGFPNPPIYFEDLAGFDEVRFMNTTAVSGWGIDDFTLGNVAGTITGNPCPPFPAPPYQINQAAASATLNGQPDPGGFSSISSVVGVGAPQTLDIASTNVGLGFDLIMSLGNTTAPSVFVTTNQQVLNIDYTLPGLAFLFGTGLPDLTNTAFPAPTFFFPFSAPIPMTVSAQMIVLDPAGADGFALSHALDFQAETCNPVQDFDLLTTGLGNGPVGWINPANGTQPWTVHTLGTTSTATGPTSAHTGANYMYCETSGFSNVVFEMDTCPMDLLQISGVTGTLNFALSRIGATIGTLELLVDDGTGGGFIPITDQVSGLPVVYTGPDLTQAQMATEWSMESVPFLHNIANTTVVIRFRYTSSTSFTGDLAIDTFSVN